MPLSVSTSLREVLDVVPAPILLLDECVQIRFANRCARASFNLETADPRIKPGDLLQCARRHDASTGCGTGPHCGRCVIRGGITESLQAGGEVRKYLLVRKPSNASSETIEVNAVFARVDLEGQAMAMLVFEAPSTRSAARQLIPICANCKRIRNSQQHWTPIESYFSQLLGADFTHGICPECGEQLYPEFKHVFRKPNPLDTQA